MRILLFCVSTILTGKAVAYEMPLHAAITEAAFRKSNLTGQQAELYARLGFDRYDAMHPFQSAENGACAAGDPDAFDAYLDSLPNWLQAPAPDVAQVRARCPQNYERRLMPLDYSGRRPDGTLGSTPHLNFQAWLMRGVIREDDLPRTSYPNANDAPDADPWTERNRPLAHFYSPVTNASDIPLAIQESLGWALGEANPSLCTLAHRL